MRMEVQNFVPDRPVGEGRRERTVTPTVGTGRLDVRATLDRLLDESSGALIHGNAPGAVSALVAGLRRLRLIVTPAEWQQCIDRCVAHDVRALIHHDPLSRHAFELRPAHPEGPVVTDYILAASPGASLDESVTAIGRALHLEILNGRWAGAVRFRRHLAARTIDECAASFPSPRVLAIGAGNLQELDQSLSYRNGEIAQIVSADPASAASRDCAPRAGVTACDSAVENFSTSFMPAGDFQLVYAMNALDSLDNAAAASLLRRMFALLAPDGMLVFSSLVPELNDGAFIEAFLGARPKYRTAFEVLALTRELGRTAATRLGADESSSVVFAAVRRVAA